MEKKKVFITVVAEQRTFNAYHYISNSNDSIRYEGKTEYPIFNVIANNVADQAEVEIIAIKFEGVLFDKNYQVLKRNIAEFEASHKIKIKLTTIERGIKETEVEHVELFKVLLEKISDNCDIFADITYGTKPTPIIIFAALNYSDKLKKNVEIKNIVYGKIVWGDKEKNENDAAFIYDVKKLFYMNSIVDNIASAGEDNAEEAVNMLFDMM